MTAPTAYPLAWPTRIPMRGKNKKSSQFKTSLSKALDNVKKSLEMFGRDAKKPISNIVISSNVTLGMQNPEESGVAVYFTWEGQQKVIPVDRYKKVQDNLQAIHHIIEARRTELRHGGIEIVRASFAGFAALPDPNSVNWRNVLGLHKVAHPTAAEIKAAYKTMAKFRHPDKETGSAAMMSDLNRARDTALKEVGS